jgi:sugar O-acyltransferase (sialic acid O-acetyltransferase NeuD family)
MLNSSTRPDPATEVVLIGAGGHAKVIIDILEHTPSTRLIGLIDSQRSPGEYLSGKPVLGSEAFVQELLAYDPPPLFIVAVGHNWHRRQIVERLRARYPSIEFATAVHPAAIVATSARIGAGTVIMAGAIIAPDVVIGEHCIINHGSSVDHDSTVEDFCSLAPGVVTGGLVFLEEGSAVNTGGIIGRGCRVGQHSVVGAGSTVIADIPGHTLAVGTPARVIRTRNPADNYF